ncbi:hypothetical protein [Desulfobacter curvatus]|uniref:hypothetical protein n=1 Tax=Desulfobacter curvatus TaxID=2290 RepID=UPI00036540E9|nr:hypothetical protein [Desulfobacter curvatus]
MRTFVFLIWAVLVVVVGCGNNTPATGKDSKGFDLTLWEKKFSVQFPKTVQVIGVRTEAGMDDAIYLKIRISSADWPKFLQTSPIDPRDLSDDKRFFLGPDWQWWDPGKQTSVPTAQAFLEDGNVLNMGYRQNPKGSTDVYLMWYQR